MDITIRNLQTKIPIRRLRIKDVIRLVLRHFHITDAEISLVFVAPSRMKAFNTEYLKHDYVTDVLTFDYTGNGGSLLSGEIVICPSVALNNAKGFGTSVHKEIELYVVHGILHLMGYDDHRPTDIARMRKKEREIMRLIVDG